MNPACRTLDTTKLSSLIYDCLNKRAQPGFTFTLSKYRGRYIFSGTVIYIIIYFCNILLSLVIYWKFKFYFFMLKSIYIGLFIFILWKSFHVFSEVSDYKTNGGSKFNKCSVGLSNRQNPLHCQSTVGAALFICNPSPRGLKMYWLGKNRLNKSYLGLILLIILFVYHIGNKIVY